MAMSFILTNASPVDCSDVRRMLSPTVWPVNMRAGRRKEGGGRRKEERRGVVVSVAEVALI